MQQYDAHEQTFKAWKQHVNAERLDTDAFILQLLRSTYKDCHVTRTSASKCDLLGFAKAGNAIATRVSNFADDATRLYNEPLSRLQEDHEKLTDTVTFGRWDYDWNEVRFIIYQLTYLDRFSRINKLLFVLRHCSSEQVKTLSNEDSDRLLVAAGEWTNSTRKEIWIFDNAQWTKNKELYKSVQDASWDDVVIQPSFKRKLHQDVHSFFDRQDLYRKMKIPWKRGIIFHGVPGVGKTLFIKLLIKDLDQRPQPIPTLYVKSLDACGGPKWSIRQIFEKARRAAPCLLILEDLDSLVVEKTRSYFLNEVDGLSSNDGILMIGTTNHLDQLDPAVSKRPSRFDRKYHFDLPDEQYRLAYCHHWRGTVEDSEGLGFTDELCSVVAKLTAGFTFAYLKELFICSLLLVTRDEDNDEMNGSPDPTNHENGDKVNGEEDKPLSEVMIPTSLHKNMLFKTIMAQAEELRKDIDTAPTTSKPPPDMSRAPPIQYRMQSLLDGDA